MSLHIYLKEEAVKKIVSREYTNKNGPQVDRIFEGLGVWVDPAGYYLTVYEDFKMPIRKLLLESGSFFSFDSYLKEARREPGKYLLPGVDKEKASAKIEREVRETQSFFISGNSVEKVRELYENILDGSIRPVEPLYGKQGKSHEELERELESAQVLLDQASNRAQVFNSRLLAAQRELDELRVSVCFRVRKIVLYVESS